ncbi:MAG: flippase-like domain-containing protein [Deltaproteobacteria bacterium]|nr:flippase-like domain-containing protein [Deltaproteobacteria bacterium]
MGTDRSTEASDPNGERVDKPPSRLFRWLLAAIGPAILALILWSIDLGELGRVLSDASAEFWLLAYGATIPAIALRALRLWLVLGPDVDRPRFVDVLHVYAYSLFVGTVTPGRVGEFIKVIHLRRWGASPGSALASVLLERFPDITFLLTVGAVSVALFAFPQLGGAAAPILVVGAPLAAMGLFWLLLGPGTEALLRLLSMVMPKRLAAKIRATHDGFVTATKAVRRRTVALVMLLTLAAWAMNYFSNYLFARSLGLPLDYFEVAAISASCTLVALLPISIMGAGTRDAALIVMLGYYHVSQPRAVALSLLFLSLILCNALLCAYSLATPAARLTRRAQT